MNKYYFTPLLITLLLAVIFIVIFAVIYHSLEQDNADPYARGWMNAFYTATTIQTNIGMAEPPKKESTTVRAWYIVQSIISYVLTIGLVFVLFKVFFNGNSQTTSVGAK
jgi:hypothetical protein